MTLENENKADIYYFDSSSFNLTPNIPYAWQKKDADIKIETAHSRNINVLGFLNRNNSISSFMFECNIDSEIIVKTFEEFIKTLNPERNSYIVIDNAPTHTSKLFESMKPIWKEKNVEIVNLSAYSPELNKIEILWRFMKYAWMPFDAYTSYEKLYESVEFILINIGKLFTISFA